MAEYNALLECNVDHGSVQKRALYTAEATSVGSCASVSDHSRAWKKVLRIISGGDASLARDMIELEMERKGEGEGTR